MKKYLIIAISIVLFSGCEDKEQDIEPLDYINCKWLKTRTLIGTQFLEIVYCESDCPNGDTIWDSEWVHYYRDDDMVEYKLKSSNSIRTWDLTKNHSYTYEPK